MGFFGSLFGLDKVKKNVDDYINRCEGLKKICGEPYFQMMESVLFVDVTNEKFYFDHVTNEKYRASFDFGKYVGVDLIVNETIINQHHTSISGAIVGGMLFGTAGAIVGGINGKTTQEKKIESIKLIFNFDDFDHPIIEINQPVDKHSYNQRFWIEKINEINEKIAKIEYLVKHRR